MKYLIACLLIPSVQIVFLLAFTMFALGIGIAAMTEKIKPRRIPVRACRNRR